MKKRFILFSLIVMFILTLGVSIMPNVNLVSAQNYEIDDRYTIVNYDMKVNVNLNNSFDIVETIQVNTHARLSNFHRYIPHTVNIRRGNKEYEYGTTITIESAKILETNTEYYYTEDSNNNLLITLSDGQLYPGSVRTYEIKYNYYIGYDRVEEYDEFYFNLNGPFWTGEIKQFNFEINFPKSIDINNNLNERMLFYIGEYGDNNENVIDEINLVYDNYKITGSTKNSLQPFNALTIALQLEEDYFSEVVKPNRVHEIVIVGLCLAAIAFALIIYHTLSDKRKSVETVEFYPPNGIDPVKLGFIYNGKINPKTLSSLIVYFASLGYLRIIDNDDEISLLKLKNLPNSATEYEKMVFKALFKDKASRKQIKLKNLNISDIELGKISVDESNEIKENSLEDDKIKVHLPIALSGIQKTAGEEMAKAIITAKTNNKNRISKKSILYGGLMMLISIIPIAYFSVVFSIRINISDYIFYGIVGMFFSFIAGLLLVYGFSKVYPASTKRKIVNSLIAVVLIMFGAMAVLALYSEPLLDIYYLRVITLIPFIFSILLMVKNLSLTNEYRDVYGQVLGFRKNLLLVEKNRIEVLLKDNPSYFYDILPYAYVLGITKEYMKKFEGLINIQPEWYVGGGRITMFDVIILNSILNSTHATFRKSIATYSTKNINTGGGGFGGFGGFSGGGFGGGGGGMS